jgi:hypothetical protein
VTRSWSTPAPAVAAAWALAALLGLAAFLADDNAGRLLLGLAAALAGALAAFGSVARPRLAVDDTGVTVRGFTGSQHLPWHQVKVKLTHTRRFGRESTTLELDAEEHLVVLTRLDLGADPEEVAEVLHALRP